MKFLVIGRGIDYGGPIDPSYLAMFFENVVMPSFEVLKKWENEKKVVGGLFAGQRAGAIIIEASSAEELSSWLQSLPFWGSNTWEVVPLQTIQSGIDNLKKQVAEAKKMAAAMAAMKQ